MISIWSDKSIMPGFNKLDRDISTDVLIIGGGLAGVLCAYMLQQAGVDYVLAEADTVCSGITRNTTAKITVQHGLIYDHLMKSCGQEKASMYYRANLKALEAYKRLCADIACDYVEKDAYVYSIDNRDKLEKELDAMRKLGADAKFEEGVPLPFPVAGAVKLEGQAQFHPLKFAGAIAAGLHIYEHTRVLELTETGAVTNGGQIKARRMIVTTHFPFLNKHGSYFLKMYQHRSYVIALEHGPDLHGMYVDEKQNGMSFRNYKDMLLIGGGDHRTGKKGGNWQELRTFAKTYYPDLKERYAWAAQDCMTLDQIPYIGPYSNRTPSLYVATGFQKWGMTTSMVSAMILADMVTGIENPYAPVFSPSRNMLKPQLAVNAFEATVNLLSFSKKRCPHLGCALKWNETEHSWDCPCHGSRFDADGKLKDNPATGDLKGYERETESGEGQ